MKDFDWGKLPDLLLHVEETAEHFAQGNLLGFSIDVRTNEFHISWDESWSMGGHETGRNTVPLDQFIEYARQTWDMKQFEKRISEEP
jgi:hypothetical protein